MPRTQVERAFGTQAQIAAFTPASGEFIYDSDRDTIVVGDGATLGGFVVAAPHLANTFSRVQTITPPANSSALVSSGSLTGANAQPVLDLSSLWNTAGDPSGIKLNITNTASGASALLLDLQKDALSRFQVRKSGFVAVLRQEADVSASSFELTKRGTTGNALAALSNGSAVGAMLFRGYDGTAFGDAGSVRTFTTQAWAVGAHGTQLNFNTVPVGSAVEATHATLTSTELAVTSRLSLPNTTSATVGGIYFGGVRAFHNFGTSNIFGGVGAGNFTLTGANNTVIGSGAGVAITSGGYNSFFGRLSGAANTTGAYNSFFGASAGAANTTGTRNSFFGLFAGAANTSGGNNCFFGYVSGLANTTGTYNSFFGRSAGAANTSGVGNCFFGARAGTANTTGLSNNAIGNNCLAANTTGDQNNAQGFNALASNTTGDNNNAVGGQALASNTTGAANSAVGFNALASNTTGVQNNAYGGEALFTCIVGNFNNALGFQALFLATGSNNIAFGQGAGNNLTTGSNNIFIGHLIGAPVATGSNQLSIGNLIFGTGVDGTGTTISSGNGGVGVITPLSKWHVAGDIRMSLGGSLVITAGANTRAGNAVLVGGTVTVANTTVTANTVIMLTRKTSGGTIGTAITYTVIANTSFTITSDSVLDTSTFSYMLIENP